MSKILVFALFFDGLLWGAPVPNQENCHFYLDLEKEASCWYKVQDHSDYLIEYGYKYCRIFKQKALSWEDERTTWVDRTALCLQEALTRSFDTCQQIEQKAYDSHPGCYRKTGFCNLGTWQKTTIIMTAMGMDFLLKPVNSFYQGFRILKECVSDVPLELEELHVQMNKLVQSGQLSRNIASTLFMVEKMSEKNLNLYLKYFYGTIHSKTFSTHKIDKVLEYKSLLDKKSDKNRK